MVKMSRAEATMAMWALVACILSGTLAATRPHFVDVSVQKGLLSYKQIDKSRVTLNKYWGTTIADFDKDGNYDIFLSNHVNNAELYFMQPDKTYKFRNPDLRGADLHATAAADMDNDGYLDFMINMGGSSGENVNGHAIVHKVRRDQSFTRRDRNGVEYRDLMGIGGIPHRGRSMMLMDMNGDGYLDLLFLNQNNFTATYSHHVYENLGNGKFVFRNNTGIEQVDGHWGQVVDANNDSYPDILILKWYGVELWLGTGDFRFKDGTHLIPDAASNKTHMKRVRCAAEIDYDGDGDLDIILARGNTNPQGGDDDILLENKNGIFRVVSNPGFKVKRDHFHVTVGDFNNDGHMDMYFSVMTQFTKPRKPDWMYVNEGDGTFSLAPGHGTESTKPESDGDNANAFDYNLDGRIDLLVGSRNDAWKLYENRSDRGSNHYILVRVGEPRGKLVEPLWFHRKALGALVKVFCTHKGKERVFVQRVGSAGQSHSQSYTDTLHFGLGGCTFVDSIEIHYQGEVVVKRTGVAVDQLVTVGMYFPCPAGRLGKGCDDVMTPCSTSPCGSGEECETVELVGRKCVERGCDVSIPTATPQPTRQPTPKPTPPPTGQPTPQPKQLLENGGFEDNSAWVLSNKARYTDREFSEGSRGMRLSWQYAKVDQTITLEARVKYTLMCEERGGPVRYKVIRNGATVWKNYDAPDIPVKNSNFLAKKLTFTAKKSGAYLISLVTSKSEVATIDNCRLYNIDSDPPTEEPAPELGKDLLVQGGFEGVGWSIQGRGKLQGAVVYEGERAVSLPLTYALAFQKVELSKGVKYQLQCYELHGPIRYVIYKNGVAVAMRGDRGKTVPGSAWRTKTMSFTADVSGTYQVRVSTPKNVAGYVDSCSLRAVTQPTGSRMDSYGKERILATRRDSSSVRMTNCEGGCLKLYCPV